MAIDISSSVRRTPISAQEARDFIQKETDSFGVFFDLERCFELVGLLMQENLHLRDKARRLTGIPGLYLDDKVTVAEAFQRFGVVQALLYKDGKLSITADTYNTILKNPKCSEELKMFVNCVQNFASNKRNAGYLRNIGKLPQSTQYSKLGHRMTVGHPSWSILSTSRLAAEDPGVQGIPRTMTDIVCEPEGYTLVRTDSSQIEPCINFSYFLRDELIIELIKAYRDAYFGLLHYCLMPLELEQACRNNFDKFFKKIDITDDLKDNRQNIKRLTNAGSYGSSHLDDINPALSAAYEKRLIQHPARLAYEEKVREDVNHGVDTFYGYFGTPVRPDTTEKYTKGGSGWNEHVVRCGINNPTQTTASELMLFSVNEARNILAQCRDSHICFYKHDESCFYVSDYDKDHGMLEPLTGINAYNVEGWIPILSETEIGIKKGIYPTYL